MRREVKRRRVPIRYQAAFRNATSERTHTLRVSRGGLQPARHWRKATLAEAEKPKSKVPLSDVRTTLSPIFNPVFYRVLWYHWDSNFSLPITGYGSSMGLFLTMS